MADISKYITSGTTPVPVGGTVFVPGELNLPSVINDGSVQYIKTGQAIAYDASKHAAIVAVAPGIVRYIDSYPSYAIASSNSNDVINQRIYVAQIFNPTDDNQELWLEAMPAVTGLAIQAQIFRLYKPARSGCFQLAAIVGEDFTKSLVVQNQSGSTTATVYTRSIREGIIRYMYSHNMYVAAFVVSDSYNDSTTVTVATSYDGFKWQAVESRSYSGYQFTNVSMACHNGVAVVIASNSSADAPLGFTVDCLNSVASATFGSIGASGNVHTRNIAAGPDWFLTCTNGADPLYAIPVAAGAEGQTQTVGAGATRPNMASPYRPMISVTYVKGNYYSYYGQNDYAFGAGPSPAAMSARSCIGHVATTLGGLIPCKNGVLSLGEAATSKNVWWCSDGVNTTAIDNQTTVRSQMQPWYLYENFDKGALLGGGQVVQALTQFTDSTLYQDQVCYGGMAKNGTTIIRWFATTNNTAWATVSVVCRSTDDGKTWTVVFARVNALTAAPAQIGIRTIKYLNGKWVGVCSNGKVIVSANDGVTFTESAVTGMNTTNELWDVGYFQSKWYVCGLYANSVNYAYSSDLLTWTAASVANQNILGMAYDANTIVFNNRDNTDFYWSTTGLSASWTTASGIGSKVWYDTANSRFLAFTISDKTKTSTDGRATWNNLASNVSVATPLYTPNALRCPERSIEYFDGAYYAVGQYFVSKSTDLVNWSPEMYHNDYTNTTLANLGDRLEVLSTGGQFVGTIYNKTTPKFIGLRDPIELNGAVGYVRVV